MNAVAGIESPPSLAHRLLYLDGWRGIAIVGVFFDHFVSYHFLNTGKLGVELFFALSGRLMAQILFIDEMPLGDFYYRRFSRLWPTLAAFMASVFVVGSFHPAMGITPLAALSVISYTYNYYFFFNGSSVVVQHIWSLCVEEHSYIVLGLVAAIVRKHARALWPLLIGLLVASLTDGIVSTLVLKQEFYHVYWRSDVHAFSILVGAAFFLARVQNKVKIIGNAVVFVGLVGLLLNINHVPDVLKYSLGTACLAACVANIEYAASTVKAILSQSWIVWIGTISYSLYIWQQPFKAIDTPHVTLRIVILLSAIACGIASFYILERPTRRWLNAHPPRWAK